MYLNQFGLREPPFGVTPDPRYFYSGRTHEAAVASLLYGIERRAGFVLVTGEVGTGKTLLCRHLLSRLGETTSTALVLNPCLAPLELIRVILADFGIRAATGEKSELIAALNRFLLAKLQSGEHVVLILDEAQTLPEQSLEEIRLLSNLETDREKLLQIVLVGQPELLAKLRLPQLRQVNQRIAVRCHLQPLAPREIRQYVAHRLHVASGRERPDLFSAWGLRAVSLLSRGYPREINALCDRALLATYAAGRRRAGVRLVLRAYRDLRAEAPRSSSRFTAALRWVLPTLLLSAAAWLTYSHEYPNRPSLPPAAAPALPAVSQAVPAPAGVSKAVVAAAPEVPRPTRPDPDAASDGASLSASLATLAQAWRLAPLADEVRQWQFVSLKDRSLPAFFQKSGLARTHGMEIVALPAALSTLRETNLPCLASEQTGSGYRFVVLAGLQQALAVILDPVAGRRVQPVAEWLSHVRGPFFVLVPEGTLAPPWHPGDRGAAVHGLQRALRRAGFLRGNPDGVYGRVTVDAVTTLQRKHGIGADGVAGLATRLVLLRLGGTAVPSLREAP